MNISGYSIQNKSQYGKVDQYKLQSNITQNITSKEKKIDTIEISSEAYELQKTESKMSAYSGKDVLGISKGNGANDYKIHFSDSAMVSRAISRGKITVNGVDIELSEEVVKKLKVVDRQAEQDSLKSFMERHYKHNAAVAKQQAEAWKKALETPDSISILLGIEDDKSGHRVTKPDGCTSDGVCGDDFEWKTYETVLDVNLDGGKAVLGDVRENEIVINAGK